MSKLESKTATSMRPYLGTPIQKKGTELAKDEKYESEKWKKGF